MHVGAGFCLMQQIMCYSFFILRVLLTHHRLHKVCCYRFSQLSEFSSQWFLKQLYPKAKRYPKEEGETKKEGRMGGREGEKGNNTFPEKLFYLVPFCLAKWLLGQPPFVGLWAWICPPFSPASSRGQRPTVLSATQEACNWLESTSVCWSWMQAIITAHIFFFF